MNCHDGHYEARCTFEIAAVPVLATGNPALGTNISVEIEIVATGASIKTHTAALAAKTCYVANTTLATKTSAQFGIL